ncbi:MAG: class I SAM-dependent methyltransferase [Nanoarchaeota archaeon]|nr:class I SAM-dependent methyltransferase [Nanoarchaeota archaeon]
MRVTKDNQREKYDTTTSWRPQPDDFSENGGNRFSLRSHHGIYFNLVRYQEFLKMLSYGNVEFSGKKILDIGCHLGLFSNLLASLKHDSADVYGLDFTEDFIKIAKKTNPGINYVQGNVYELPFEKEFFDLVLCNLSLMRFP